MNLLRSFIIYLFPLGLLAISEDHNGDNNAHQTERSDQTEEEGSLVPTPACRHRQRGDNNKRNLGWENILSAWRRLWKIPKLPGVRPRQCLPSSPHERGAKTRKGQQLVRGGISFDRIARTANAVEILPDASLMNIEENGHHDDWEPHAGLVLEVGSSESRVDVTYELLEPLHLELGVKLNHARDYYYTPVIESILEPTMFVSNRAWWKFIPWWKWDRSSRYRMEEEFAGGSHGEVWRGRRKCADAEESSQRCRESLIFKRLKAELGFNILEAGLREVYFGGWLASLEDESNRLFTTYVDHFFRKRGPRQQPELWIVFADAGSSLRSFLYTAQAMGDFIIYRHSYLWTQLRMSLQNSTNIQSVAVATEPADEQQRQTSSMLGRHLMRSVLQQILSAAAFLHERGIVHRDLKPSNVICETNVLEDLHIGDGEAPFVKCVLGDLSSAWNVFTDRNLYSRGPSRAEQTDEYAPPEAIFGNLYSDSEEIITPAFDSWSIGIIMLELLLGTPNVFMVDQRTRVVLTHKMEKEGASELEIQRAIYLAALSQFCIYHPSAEEKTRDWPLRKGDPLHRSKMVKQSCNLKDFHRALRARDPLGIGFDSSTDSLLHLIWQLLAWNPKERMTPAQALRHPYFTIEQSSATSLNFDDEEVNALESQMLDPRMDFNVSDSVNRFVCPRCGRVFDDWASCHNHARARKHAMFCTYDRTALPTCLNAHSMLPAHASSGYCDIQGRRRVIEDFHAIHLLPSSQLYAIFDGHRGNLGSKFCSTFVPQVLESRLSHVDELALRDPDWKKEIENIIVEAFAEIHENFLKAISLSPFSAMDQSGTTATAVLVTSEVVVVASLGDSRAVQWSRQGDSGGALVAIQLTKDHVASDASERKMVESRGGHVVRSSGIDRVNGTLAITRSIGDADLAPVLSQVPDVISFTRDELKARCGGLESSAGTHQCILVVASDGLWDVVSSQEAVEMVADVISANGSTDCRESACLQRAAEALTQEAFVRGSTDNIGVCVIAID